MIRVTMMMMIITRKVQFHHVGKLARNVTSLFSVLVVAFVGDASASASASSDVDVDVVVDNEYAMNSLSFPPSFFFFSLIVLFIRRQHCCYYCFHHYYSYLYPLLVLVLVVGAHCLGLPCEKFVDVVHRPIVF